MYRDLAERADYGGLYLGSVWRRGGGVRECLPTPLERAGTVPSRAGPYFLEEIGERTLGALPRDPAGEKSFFSPNPFSLDCCRSSVGFLLAYLACGL